MGKTSVRIFSLKEILRSIDLDVVLPHPTVNDSRGFADRAIALSVPTPVQRQFSVAEKISNISLSHLGIIILLLGT